MRTELRGLVIGVAIMAGGLAAFAQVKTFRPVTDEMLRNPPPADWLHSRRTYDGWSYSPLDQINRQNVGQLQLAWSWGCSQAISRRRRSCTTASCISSIPAARSRRWMRSTAICCGNTAASFRRRSAPQAEMRAMRGLSIYDDKILLNTADAHLVALDARTGTRRLGRRGRRSHTAAVLLGSFAGRARQGHFRASGLRVLRASRSARLPRTTRRPARSCGEPRRSRIPASRAATPGATSRCCIAPGPTRGSPGATIRH